MGAFQTFMCGLGIGVHQAEVAVVKKALRKIQLHELITLAKRSCEGSTALYECTPKMHLVTAGRQGR